jgi:V/A-type H+-transporting ATPase subunit I
MLRVRIQVPRRDAAAATHAIARLGLLHLIDIAHGRSDTVPPGTDVQLSAHQELRARARRVAERLDLGSPALAGRIDDPPITDFADELQQMEGTLAPIEAVVDGIWNTRCAAAGQVADTTRKLDRARRLERAGLDIRRLIAARFIALRVATGPPEAFDSIVSSIAPAPCAVVPIEGGQADVMAAIAVPATTAERVDSALRLVQLEVTGSSALEQLTAPAAIEATLRAARTSEADAQAQLDGVRAGHGRTITELLGRVEACVLLLQAQVHFGATGRFVVISGWIPEHALGAVRSALAAAAPGAVVDVERPGDLPQAANGALRIPILHRNPLLLRPFQSLIELYGTPQYREVQPTAFFGISFLIMFGLMFGDVGHGAVLAAAGYCLFRFVPRFLDYGILLGEAGVMSIVFGLLYGSLFGIEGLVPVLWMSPLHDLPSFMRVAVAFGATLVSLGLILNVVNCWRAGERVAALLSPRGLFGAFLYWTSLALIARAFVSPLAVPAWLVWILAAGAGMLVLLRAPLVARLSVTAPERVVLPRAPRWLRLLEGSVELVDTLFAYFANTISFVRIGAFAAVHAGIFLAMFAVTDVLVHLRFGGPLAVAVLVVGNVVVILLEGLTVSVQVLRLEYYEFFGKFFRGGGELYRPLMLRSIQQGGAR